MADCCIDFVVTVDLCNSSIDKTLVKGSAISFIDENIVEDRRDFVVCCYIFEACSFIRS